MTASKIVDIAQKELGTREDPPHSNCVKYNTAYYGRSVKGASYPWCMAFVWWVFNTAGASHLFFGGKKTASCTALMNYAKKAGQFVTSGFQAGDVILYQFDSDSFSDHVGICESFDGEYVTCIEGNTGSYSDADGGEVLRRRRRKSLVYGAYRPKYDGETFKGGTFELTLNILKLKSRGNQVRALQVLLNASGAALDTDGVFGPKTESALKNYQKRLKLTVDGKAGPETWSALLK